MLWVWLLEMYSFSMLFVLVLSTCVNTEKAERRHLLIE